MDANQEKQLLDIFSLYMDGFSFMSGNLVNHLFGKVPAIDGTPLPVREMIFLATIPPEGNLSKLPYSGFVISHRPIGLYGDPMQGLKGILGRLRVAKLLTNTSHTYELTDQGLALQAKCRKAILELIAPLSPALLLQAAESLSAMHQIIQKGANDYADA